MNNLKIIISTKLSKLYFWLMITDHVEKTKQFSEKKTKNPQKTTTKKTIFFR